MLLLSIWQRTALSPLHALQPLWAAAACCRCAGRAAATDALPKICSRAARRMITGRDTIPDA